MKTKREMESEIKALEQKRHSLNCQIAEIDSRLETLESEFNGMIVKTSLRGMVVK